MVCLCQISHLMKMMKTEKKCFEYHKDDDESKTLMIKNVEAKIRRKNIGEPKSKQRDEKKMNILWIFPRNLNKAEEVSVARPTPNSSNTMKINKGFYMFLVLNAYLLHARCSPHIEAVFLFQFYANSSVKPYHTALLPG